TVQPRIWRSAGPLPARSDLCQACVPIVIMLCSINSSAMFCPISYIMVAMLSQLRSPTANHPTSVTCAILPNDEAVQIRRAPPPLAAGITTLVIQEFLIVGGSAYVASVIYHEAMFMEWPSSPLYAAAALLVAAMVESTALGFGHYKNSQSQARHVFLWSGIGAVALAFSF